MLSMQNIAKLYRIELIETHALEDFSLEVRKGEFVAIMGPSGSGKTTFLNVAGLLDTFDSGTYLLDAQDVSRLSDTQMSKIRNRNIGFIFQSFNLLPAGEPLGSKSRRGSQLLTSLFRKVVIGDPHDSRIFEIL